MSDYVAKSSTPAGNDVFIVCTAPWARATDSGQPLVFVFTPASQRDPVSQVQGRCTKWVSVAIEPYFQLFALKDDCTFVPFAVKDTVHDFTFEPFYLKQTARQSLATTTGMYASVCWARMGGETCILAAAGLENLVKKWTVLSEEPEVRRFAACEKPTCVSASQSLVAVGFQRHVSVFDTAGRIIWTIASSWTHWLYDDACCLSLDGRTVASRDSSGYGVRVCDALTGAWVDGFVFSGFVERITCSSRGWLVSTRNGKCDKQRVFEWDEYDPDVHREVLCGSAVTSVAPCDGGTLVTAFGRTVTVLGTDATERSLHMSAHRLAWMGCVVRAQTQVYENTKKCRR